MQRRAEEATADIRNTIIRDYFNPFIKSLKESGLDENRVIKKTISMVQLNYSYIIDLFIDTSAGIDPLFDYGAHEKNPWCQTLFLDHAAIKEQYIRLGSLYLDENVQKTVFEGVHIADIQTCIRELFHDYLAPLPALQIKRQAHDSLTIAAGEEEHTLLHSMPVGAERSVSSHLDYASMFSAGRSCKAEDALPQDGVSENNNVFYMVAGHVKTTILAVHIPTYSITWRDEIPVEELVNSFDSIDSTTVRIFPSLYQAVEAAHSLKRTAGFNCQVDSSEDDDEDEVSREEDDRMKHDENGFMPSIWAVYYAGNPDHLTFSQERIIFNKYKCPIGYAETLRNASLCFATVPVDSVRPLVGTVLVCGEVDVDGGESEFGDYKIWTTVNRDQYRKESEVMLSEAERVDGKREAGQPDDGRKCLVM